MKKLWIPVLSMGLVFGLASCGNGATGFDKTKNITLYTRDTTSGTRDGFFSKIGLGSAKEDDSPLAKVTTVESNGDMITKVKNDEYGVGYISLSSLEGSGVKGLTYENVQPTEANVLNETYKLTRNFNYVIRDSFESTTKQEIVEAFVAYMSTSEGKATIKSHSGIVELSSSDKSWDDIKANYPVAAQDNKNVTIKFGGSTSVEKIAKALSAEFSTKCGNFVAEHNHTGSGDAFKYTQGAKKDDSAKLDIGFLSRELSDTEPAAANTAGKICVDAIVAVVNEKNPLSSVKATDLSDMYTGKIVKWESLLK